MANNIIGAEDLLKPDIIDSFKKLDDELTEVIKTLQNLAKEGRNVMASLTFKTSSDIDKFVSSLKAADAAMAQAVKTEAAQAKIRTENARALIQEQKLQQESIKIQQLNTKQAQDAEKQAQKNATAQAKLNSAYSQASKELSDVKKQLKDLSVQGLSNTDQAEQLRQKFTQLDKTVRTAEEGVGEYNRSVGNYKKAVGDAILETGLFNNTIGQLALQFKNLIITQNEAGASVVKFSAILKASGILLAVAAIAAIKELGELNQAIIDIKDIGVAKGKDFFLGGNAFETAEKNSQAFRIELRELQKQLQELTLNEQADNEIANDATIGFQARNAALKEAIGLSEQRASVDVKIAQGQLDRANEEIAAREAAVGLGRATNDLLDKRKEAEQNLNAALHAQGELTRQNAEKERQQDVSRATAEIDLLRSKRESAQAQSTILQKQLEDERNQIEQRIELGKKLLAADVNTTDQEIEIFKRDIKIRFDANKLLQEQDAVRLKQRLDALRTNAGDGLGADAEAELAKIIKQFQENQIKNNEIIKKQNEELLLRRQKILEIERKINIENLQDAAKGQEIILTDQKTKVDKINEDILKGFNVFSGKLLKLRKFEIAQEEADIVELAQKRKEVLGAQAQDEIQNATDSIKDEKIRAETIKEINNKLRLALNDNSIDQAEKEKELNLKQLEEEKKINQARIKEAGEFTNKILDDLDKRFRAQNERTNKAQQLEVDTRQKSIDRQQALADRGQANTLAFEKSKLAEAQLAQQKQQKAEERQQKTIAFLRLLAGYAQSDAPDALKKAAIDIALATAITGSFAAGVEALQGKGTTTSDENLVLLSNKESVITADGTADNPGLATAMNKGTVKQYFENIYLPKYLTPVSQLSFADNMGNSAALNHLSSINNRLQSLENTIKNKRETTTNWDKHGNLLVSEVEAGIKRTVQYVKRKPRI